jgi:hypothetical protein
MRATYDDWLFANTCDEIENRIRLLGLVHPDEVVDQVITPMKREREYAESFLDVAFVKVMEVLWNLDAEDLFGCFEEGGVA